MKFYDNLLSYKNNIAAITDAGEKVTYADISGFADRLYEKINHRCLVFCLCQNSFGSLCGYVSFIKGHIVPLLIDKDLNSELLDKLIETYKPEYLWVPDYKIDISYEGMSLAMYNQVFSEYGYTLLKTSFNSSYKLFPELALLLTTSGSTGSPKLVRQSYNNLNSNAAAIAQYLEITSDERPITTLPMNYTYGLSVINSHLLKGATLLLTSKTLMEKGFWQFLKEQNATSFSGVPYTYEMLKKLRFFRMDLPSLKTMTQAGGKLTEELTKEFAEFCLKYGKRFYVMYGQTEATARMSYLSYEYAATKCGSMGRAIPGGEFSLVDDNGNIINKPDTIGELVYKGPNVALGYAECGEDLSKGNDWDGVLLTGDIVKCDFEGFYYIVGRKNRFIKLYGNRINLDETERLIKMIMTECACIGSDDHMVVYVTELGKEDEVRRFVAGKTGINPVAFDVRFINEIPKNEAGKIIYSKLLN